MNISSSRPSPGRSSSPAPTDIQDTQSSHSQPTTTAAPSEISTHSNGSARNRTKTEYKSNFKPFDQYVYNELTDSFVKHVKPASACLQVESGALSASNQDLSLTAHANVDVYATSSTSPALEASVFEPNNAAEHVDATQEPWYKEVVKRNEKANEYRYKSEVGHSSPLFTSGAACAASTSEETTNCLGDHHLTLASSPGDEPPAADAEQRNSPAPTQFTNHSDELSSRRSYKFTPHDYKRDHLIATMANNNNFNLPKEQRQQERPGARSQPARAPPTSTTAGARTGRAPSAGLARTTAASRARSQSSRRQVAGAPATVANSATGGGGGGGGPASASKSNQSSPVKSAAPRVPLSSRVASRPHVASATTTTTARTGLATARQAATTKSAAMTPNGAPSRPSTAAPARARTPLASSTPARPTATRLTSASQATARTSATAGQSRPSPTAARTPAAASARVAATTRSPSTKPTATATATAAATQPRSPVKRATGATATPIVRTAASSRASSGAPSAAARNSLASRATGSRSGSTSAAAAPAAAASNSPKSIKSKALADAGEKAAAALAAATLATGVAAAAAAAATTPPVASESSSSESVAPETAPAQETAPAASNTGGRALGDDYFMNQEPNLIITTTETGNMLADEIARAEREAQEAAAAAAAAAETSQPAETPLVVKEPAIVHEQLEASAAAAAGQQQADVSPADELVNGLSGVIVSAEDRYDSSERDTSGESEEASRPVGGGGGGGLADEHERAANYEEHQRQQHLQQSDDTDEPYSLMPTTFDATRRLDGDELPSGPLQTGQVDTISQAIAQIGVEHETEHEARNLREELGEPESEPDETSSRALRAAKQAHEAVKHVAFDLMGAEETAERVAISALEEPEVIESTSVAKLEAEPARELDGDQAESEPDLRGSASSAAAAAAAAEGLQEAADLDLQRPESRLDGHVDEEDDDEDDEPYEHLEAADAEPNSPPPAAAGEADDLQGRRDEVAKSSEEEEFELIGGEDAGSPSRGVVLSPVGNNDEAQRVQEGSVETRPEAQTIEEPNDLRGVEEDGGASQDGGDSVQSGDRPKEPADATADATAKSAEDGGDKRGNLVDESASKAEESANKAEESAPKAEEEAKKAEGDAEKSDEEGVKKADEGEKKGDEEEPVEHELELAHEPVIVKKVDDHHKLTEVVESGAMELDGPILLESERAEPVSASGSGAFEQRSIEVPVLQSDLHERKPSIDLLESTQDLMSSQDAAGFEGQKPFEAKIESSERQRAEAASGELVGGSTKDADLLVAAASDEPDGAIVPPSSNELLMNVADLVGAETRMKEEMARKSELARQRSNSRSSLSFAQSGELLLSPEQLGDQFAHQSGLAADAQQRQQLIENDDDDEDGDSLVSSEDEIIHLDEPQVVGSSGNQAGDLRADATTIAPDQTSDESQVKVASSRLDGFNGASATIDPIGVQQVSKEVEPEAHDIMSSGLADQSRQTDQAAQGPLEAPIRSPDFGESADFVSNKTYVVNSAEEQRGQQNLMMGASEFDEEDEAQELKLSNHLTNSDDDIILAPRNIKEPRGGGVNHSETTVANDDCFSPERLAPIGSRYNEGAGLSAMAPQLIGELELTVEQETPQPTLIEKRVELATSKQLPLGELAGGLLGGSSAAAAAANLVAARQRSGFDSDDDDDVDDDVNQRGDPIDAAATLSPSASAAEGMLLRLGRDLVDTSEAVGAPAHRVAGGGDSLERDADTYIINTGIRTAEQRDQNEAGQAANASIINNNNNNNYNNTGQSGNRGEYGDQTTTMPAALGGGAPAAAATKSALELVVGGASDSDRKEAPAPPTSATDEAATAAKQQPDELERPTGGNALVSSN